MECPCHKINSFCFTRQAAVKCEIEWDSTCTFSDSAVAFLSCCLFSCLLALNFEYLQFFIMHHCRHQFWEEFPPYLLDVFHLSSFQWYLLVFLLWLFIPCFFFSLYTLSYNHDVPYYGSFFHLLSWKFVVGLFNLKILCLGNSLFLKTISFCFL